MPPIISDPIPYGPDRAAQMRAYSRRHYARNTGALRRPRVIVQHVTAGPSYASAFNTFAANARDAELGELPGVCAHFIIDRSGRIHRLVSIRKMCRHTVGLNWTAIGVEHVGTTTREVLANPRMMRSSLRLTRWLQSRLRVRTKDVIGHNESLSSPYHRERVARLRRQTHGDFTRSEMRVFRTRLGRLPNP